MTTRPDPSREAQPAWRHLLPGGGKPLPHWMTAAVATILLLILGTAIEPRTVGAVALLSMLPFMAILAVASIGQHLVIQQRGLDLSVAGIISFSAVLITNLTNGSGDPGLVISVVALTLAVGMVVGALSGLIITLIGVPPLVTTIGVNAFMYGLTLWLSAGTPRMAPPPLSQFALGRSFGLPNTIIVMLIFAAVATFIVNRSTLGRRFLAVGANPVASHALGIPVELYKISTYMVAGFCYAVAGIMLAGFLNVPSLFSGNPFLLATVAAVVVGGNSITGERGSIIATVIGAFFMTYLGQLVLSLGLTRSSQQIVQALVVIGGVGLPILLRRRSSSGELEYPR